MFLEFLSPVDIFLLKIWEKHELRELAVHLKNLKQYTAKEMFKNCTTSYSIMTNSFKLKHKGKYSEPLLLSF